jgi:hypothetical protein
LFLPKATEVVAFSRYLHIQRCLMKNFQRRLLHKISESSIHCCIEQGRSKETLKAKISINKGGGKFVVLANMFTHFTDALIPDQKTGQGKT